MVLDTLRYSTDDVFSSLRVIRRQSDCIEKFSYIERFSIRYATRTDGIVLFQDGCP